MQLIMVVILEYTMIMCAILLTIWIAANPPTEGTTHFQG